MLGHLIILVKVAAVLGLAVMLFARLVNPVDAEWLKRKPLWILLGFYAIGMFGHNVWVIYIAMIAMLPLLAVSRGEGAALFVIALCAVPDLTTYVTAGGVSLLAFDKYLCLSLGLLLLFLKTRPSGPAISGRFDLPFLLLLVNELAQARDMNATTTIRTVLGVILGIGLPYFLVSRSLTKVEDLRRVMIALAFITFVQAVVSVFEAGSYFLIYHELNNAMGIVEGATAYKARGGLLRASGAFPESTSFALFLVLGLVATLACRQSFRSTSKLALAVLAIAAGIFCTGSRNAWLTLAVSILAFDIYRRRYLAFFGKGAVLAGMFSVAQLAAELSPYVATMLGKTSDTAGTGDYRELLLTRGMEEFWKRPYLGTSILKVRDNLQDLIQGEGFVDFVNGYLFYALTVGALGPILMVLAFLLPCWAMLSARRRLFLQDPLVQRTAAFVFASCTATVLSTAFTAFGGRPSIFFYLTQAVASALFAWRLVPPDVLAASDRGDVRQRYARVAAIRAQRAAALGLAAPAPDAKPG